MGSGQELQAVSMNYGQWPGITGSIHELWNGQELQAVSMNYGQWPGIIGSIHALWAMARNYMPYP